MREREKLDKKKQKTKTRTVQIKTKQKRKQGKTPKTVGAFSGFKSGGWCACYVYIVMKVIMNSFGTFAAACVFLPVQSKKNVFITRSS